MTSEIFLAKVEVRFNSTSFHGEFQF